ncbi:PIN domain-containing protein [Candidatus Albibeggiatoa sp. nov. BB20]|uniref:type II toxin-antitoxin system VapC family toxin n=1 Tax=Candidatus Albibeggiatoa sp. nov. BB20 TaxID=3162723 RepID=UPI0033655EF2
MKQNIIVDTGPLVAYLSQRDKYHIWTYQQLEQISPPLLTCEAVLTEACFLISRNGGSAEDIIEMLNQGWLSTPFNLQQESDKISKFLNKYTNIPMSLADACLLRMTELLPNSPLLTFDSDFSIYRKHGKETINTITPW